MKHSTDEFSAALFRPHGRIKSEVQGHIFVQTAKGPFNEQIVSAMRSVHSEALVHLATTGPWGAIFHIEQSALSSFPMLGELTLYLSSQVQNGTSSVGTAIVIADDVDGASMMAPHYVNAWKNAGIPCQHFSTLEAGRSWIEHLLGQSV